MVEREDVVGAFRWILGREPESETTIGSLLRHDSRQALRNEILGSPEFREFYAARYLSIFRFALIRIPKTASSSLLAGLRLAGLPTTPVDGPMPNLAQVFQNSALIAGHFTYGDVVAKTQGLRPIYIATVRDPVSRAVSLYRQAFDQSDHPCHAEVVERTLLESLKLEGLFYEWVFNAQCRHLSNHHLFRDVEALMQRDYFIVCGMAGLGRLLRVVCRLAGAPLVDAPRENVSPPAGIANIALQPGHEEAVAILHWLTAEDQKLVRHVGDFRASEPMIKLLSNRVGVLE
jgi:hypothetical protein